MNKSINFFKNLTVPKLLNGSVHQSMSTINTQARSTNGENECVKDLDMFSLNSLRCSHLCSITLFITPLFLSP